MAQTNYTPISLYYSATATNVPTAGNLVAGELALNTADGKLFYKDSGGVVQTLATKGTANVIQVVNATYSTVTTVSTSTYVTTGLAASITPKFSTSKILVLATCTTFTSGSATGLAFQISRGATAIYTSPNYSSYSQSGGGVIATNTLNWLDSPATTSSTTYTLQFNSAGGAQTAQYGSAPSSIILMEVAV